MHMYIRIYLFTDFMLNNSYSPLSSAKWNIQQQFNTCVDCTLLCVNYFNAAMVSYRSVMANNM